MDRESLLLVFGMAAEGVIILLLLRGRVYKTFPIFFAYLCWSLLCDLVINCVRILAPPEVHLRVYQIQLVLDSAMIFAVLVEVCWNVLRPIRSSLPKYSLLGIAALVAVGGAILWPIAGLAAPDYLTSDGMTLFRLQQTPAILRAVFFLALAAFSQVLSIGWRDRELQIATGLGFYSIISLAITILHTHETVGTTYHWLDLAGGISYLVALMYWVYSFASETAERREFSPRMQSMLLAVAGAARTTRVALDDSNKAGKQKDR